MTKQEQKVFRQSKQRNRILELLRSTDSHPTADWLYPQLKDEFPNLSFGTVYRNLATLIEQDLVKKICDILPERKPAQANSEYRNSKPEKNSNIK